MSNLKTSACALISLLALSGCNSTPHVQNQRPKTTGPASVPDDASARLTNAAERDYLSLRERIGIATSQISGLQDYITNVCLK